MQIYFDDQSKVPTPYKDRFVTFPSAAACCLRVFHGQPAPTDSDQVAWYLDRDGAVLYLSGGGIGDAADAVCATYGDRVRCLRTAYSPSSTPQGFLDFLAAVDTLQ